MKINVILLLMFLSSNVILTSCVPSPTNPPTKVTESIEASTSKIIPSQLSATTTPTASNHHGHQLASWTADRADEIIATMEKAVVEFWEAETRPGNLYPPYRVVWYAAWDALARFPDDPRQETWRWKMAYYMALSGEGNEATEIYIGLITDALNQEGIAPEELQHWFRSGELTTFYLTPAFSLEIEPITVPGNESGYLLNIGELADIDTPGSSCLLVVESEGTFTAHIVQNGFAEYGFFVTSRNPSRCYAEDLTDDGIDEIVVDQFFGGHVGTTTISVFDVTSLPPKVMPFTPASDENLMIWNGWIKDHPKVDGKTQLQVGVALDDCWDYGLTDYEWNDAWFAVSHGEVVLSDTPYQSDHTSLFCAVEIQYYAKDLNHQDAFWIYDNAYTAYLQHALNRIEVLDEFRVLMGLASAYQGDNEMARSIFHAIGDAPTTAGSIWIQPAQDFLEAYRSPSDLFRACSVLEACAPYYGDYVIEKECVDIRLCDDQAALRALVTTVFSASPLAQITGSVRLAGVNITSDGWYDFDGDAKEELWFNVLQPGETTYEFWIVAEHARGMKALLALEGLSSQITETELEKGEPVQTIDRFDNTYMQYFEFIRHPLTGEPFVVERYEEEPDPLRQDLETFLSLRKSLYQGSAPTPIYEQLLSIQNIYSNCPFAKRDEDDITTSVYDCAAFYYTMAFAAELANKEVDAVEGYLYVLSEYPDSPFALLAQEKLGQE